MEKYLLSENFSIVECQDECLIYTVNSIQEDEVKKDITLYLNKTAFFILKAILQNKNMEEIEKEVRKVFSFPLGEEEKLQEKIKKTIIRLKKIGVVIVNEN
jgi:hypothetical protein